MYKEITGIIISDEEGAQSNFQLKLGDKSVIEHTKNLMTSLFERVIVISTKLEEYDFLGLEIFPQFFNGLGPLSSIHAGLFHTNTAQNFIIPFNMSLMSQEMIKYIVDFKTDALITVAKAEGEVYQKVGMFAKKCFVPAEEILKRYSNTDKQLPSCNVLRLMDAVGAHLIAADLLPFYSSEIFFSINNYDNSANILQNA